MKVLFALFIAAVSLSAAPNYVLIFCDDLGYGDLGCYGSKKNRTPRIDQLAREGMRFTDFYSSSPVCTPSRASLMTGCYARRVGMHEDFTGHWVLIPRSRRGLNPNELTLPEALKAEGYTTASSANGILAINRRTCPLRTVMMSTMVFPIPTTWPTNVAVIRLCRW